MKTGKAVVFFILGLILALLAFPTAWAVSAGLGYSFAIIAVILGAYLVAKRGESRLPLVLGIVLLIISILSLVGTATIHMGLWAFTEAVRRATEAKSIAASIGETIKAEDWGITVLDLRKAEYIRKDDSYYRAKEGYKLVLVRLRIENLGGETRSASEIWDFILVSNANKSYERVYTFSLDPIWKATDEVKSKAVIFEELSTSTSLAPNTFIEGDLLFQIPIDEEPSKLHFKVGVVGGYEVTVELTE